MKKFLLVLTALVLSFVFVACQDETTAATTVAATTAAVTTATPVPQVLNWNIGADPDTLDPTLNGASDGGDVINQTFEGIVREVGGVVNPGIAESWETSADGLTVTFHLRQSNWSDGTPLTAHDFEYSWKRGMDPLTASEYSWIWEYTNITGALDAVYEGGSLDDIAIEATDDYTLVVGLDYQTPYFVSLMGFYHFMPVKQASVEDADGLEGTWAKDPVLAVSNGPFKLTEYVSGEGLVLVKNDEYWNADTVYLDTINGKFIDLATTAYVAYNAGSLDVLPSVPPAMTSALIAEDPEFHVFPVLGTYYFNFNLNDGADVMWENLALRTALTYAIDRSAITEALAAGQLPATGFVCPGFLDDEGLDFSDETGDYGIPIDDSKFAEAVTLFATAATELGYANVAALQADLDGLIVLYNTSESHKLVAEMVQESWNQVLGISLDLQNQDWATFQNTRTAGNFDIARGGWITDFMDPAGLLAIFTSENAYNDAGFDSAAFDLLMQEAQQTTDITTHFEKLYAAEALLMAGLPVMPVYYYADVYLVKDYVTGWGRSILGSLDFSHVRIEG